jgi:hypothetical protein
VTGEIAMAELNVITDTTDPAELYAAYQDFVARYERICDEIDGINYQLHEVTDPAEGQRLTAEMSALTYDSMIVLGWVSAAFAAYVFTSHGTHTDRINGTGTTRLTLGDRSVTVPNRAERRRATRGWR